RVRQCANARINKQSRPLIYYFPCYLIQDNAANDFNVGPVRFVHRGGLLTRIEHNFGKKPGWFSDYNPDIGDEGFSVTEFEPHAIAARLDKFTWVAEVKIEDREPSMGLKRAQDAIRLAIAGIGLLLPLNQVDQIGLADEWR